MNRLLNCRYQVLNLEVTTKEQFQALSFLKRTTPENEVWHCLDNLSEQIKIIMII